MAEASEEEQLQRRTTKVQLLLSLKRTFDLFAGNKGQRIPADTDSQKLKLACKVSKDLTHTSSTCATAV